MRRLIKKLGAVIFGENIRCTRCGLEFGGVIVAMQHLKDYDHWAYSVSRRP